MKNSLQAIVVDGKVPENGDPLFKSGSVCDDLHSFIAHAVEQGANGNADKIKKHEAPWGIHPRTESLILLNLSGWVSNLC
ncbi:MAG: hypothetical protein ABIO46_00495 [Chitinophagales bacterium]